MQILHASRAAASSPWQREPYRLLFPLGMALAWAGVLPWLWYALGAFDEYPSAYHSLAQIEGFLACFASGFLFTLIPRKTRTAPPRPWQLFVAMAAPVLTCVFAWFGHESLAQLCWVLLLAMLLGFAVPRLLAREADFPDTFVWVLVALVAGLVGGGLAGLSFALSGAGAWLHGVGSGLVSQGVFSSLVIGVGGMLLPAITRGDPFAQGGGLRATLVHLTLGGGFLASFFVEARLSFSLGYALRCAVVALALVPAAHLWRLPSLPGLHRRLVWLAAWMLPVGYAFVAAFPAYRLIGLHLVFIGCFGLLALVVAVHVTLSHGGFGDLLSSSPGPLRAMAALLAGALVMRLCVDLVPEWRRVALGTSAALFLAALAAWAWLVSAHPRPSEAARARQAVAGWSSREAPRDRWRAGCACQGK